MKLLSPKQTLNYLRQQYIDTPVFNKNGDINPKYEETRKNLLESPLWRNENINEFYKANPHLKEK